MTARRWGRAVALAIAVAGLPAALPGAASAATLSGKALALGSATEPGNIAVTVDAAGTGQFAWDNAPTAGANTVTYCAVPKDATGCSRTVTLTPAGAEQHIDNVQILADGGLLVILADVYGAPPGDPQDYLPEQEWVSTDAGATWSLVDGGLSVADGTINADTQPVSAVILPGTGVLGYGWETADGSPTFDPFPLASPPECSVIHCGGAAIPNGGPYPFAMLEPLTNPDPIGNPAGAEYASQSGPSAGVMGVFPTVDSNGPLGCARSFGTAFVYGTGNQSAANSYSVSPGVAGSAWKVPATQLDCNVEYPAVGGGPSGFGVLETDDANGHTIYHAFDAGTTKFDKPSVTVNAKGEEQPSLSQDGLGGLYATYALGGAGGPLELSYSGDAGAIWGSKAIYADHDGRMALLDSAVSAAGQGWAGWWDSSTNSVYAQQFDANDAAPPLAPTVLSSTQTSAKTTGTDISIPAGTVGETDQANLSGTNASIATGKVTYDLYSNSTCTKLAAHDGKVAVKAGKAAPSKPVSAALAPGKYYWKLTYAGDVSNEAASSSCGSEVLTVTAPVTSGGTASATSTAVTLTIKWAGPCTVTVTITVTPPSGKGKPITFATGKVKLALTGKIKLSVNLTGAGKNLLSTAKGPLSALVTLKTKTSHGTFTTTGKLKITT